MSAQQFSYPPMPQGVDEKVIQPSPAFKKEVVKVAVAISLFLLFYLSMVLLALGFAALCVLGGFGLIAAKPHFFTLMIGLGLAGLGLMVAFFMLKFMFKSHRTDRSNMLELQESDQPELFAFIRQLTTETKTPFPKRILLSADVNASVFYDSSFWSMFLPVKKNLVIGMGLVNCVNISEFKAILSHEFGHFSQRSMKLGSFVYNLNRIIHDMLYDNEGYEKLLEKWANISGYFAFFAKITVGIVQSIQKLLQKAYELVNRNYLGLSRQMEFHADAVAAYVSGGNHLISSLRRLEASDICYNRVLAHFNAWFPENVKADNFYQCHTEVMQHFSRDFKIPYQHGLLQVDAGAMAFFNQNRLQIKDQWASHPANEDREAHLNALNLTTETNHESAWAVFRHPEAFQRAMTAKLYFSVQFPEQPQVLDLAAFKAKYYQEYEDASFHPAYKGYYNEHNIQPFDLEAASAISAPDTSFKELFSDVNCNLPKTLAGMEADAELVKTIMDGSTKVKTFDFDGRKYTRANIYDINDQLTAEINTAREQLLLHDRRVFSYFYKQAVLNGQGNELIRDYGQHFAAAETVETDIAQYNRLMAELQVIFRQEMSFQAAQNTIDQILLYEKPVKERLQAMLVAEAFQPCISPVQRQQIETYLANQHPYFVQPSFNNEALGLLTDALQTYMQVVADWSFKQKKAFLEKQLQWRKNEQSSEKTAEINKETVPNSVPKVEAREPVMNAETF